MGNRYNEEVNLRVTVAACRQFETETAGIEGLTVVREGNLFFAP